MSSGSLGPGVDRTAKGINMTQAFQEAIKLSWRQKNSPDDVSASLR
jgi:hypothetical protein